MQVELEKTETVNISIKPLAKEFNQLPTQIQIHHLKKIHYAIQDSFICSVHIFWELHCVRQSQDYNMIFPPCCEKE